MKLIQRSHRWLGALLLLPLIGWTITGAIFLFKPGYGDAYSPLAVRSYPLSGPVVQQSHPAWFEYRVLHTVLGEHLLIRSQGGWQQLHAASLQPRPRPSNQKVIKLLEDAIISNPQRYGQRVLKQGEGFVTETGVRLSLDWPTMSLSQHGRDRTFIDSLYNIHYLRWTGHQGIDSAWGLIGLTALLLSTLLGAKLLFSRKPTNP